MVNIFLCFAENISVIGVMPPSPLCSAAAAATASATCSESPHSSLAVSSALSTIPVATKKFGVSGRNPSARMTSPAGGRAHKVNMNFHLWALSRTFSTFPRRMPKQMVSWFTLPSVPLRCFGLISAMYWGTTDEASPTPTPTTPRPRTTGPRLPDPRTQIRGPARRNAPVRSKDDFLPIESTALPARMLPNVAPTNRTDTIRPCA
mmetsp:Transcript_1632/g.5153  ORF Transcript_1632/g.5153 Transcript_1632/m.5153 type:complete len:205 (+) Transcript_1632:600-1214(+)